MADTLNPIISPEIEARFWRRCDKCGPDDCWEWSGFLDEGGYGSFTMRVDGAQKMFRAHHISMIIDGKPRVAGLQALHGCGNPACVNPAHLRWGTVLENVEDAIAHGKVKRSLNEEQVRAIRVSSESDRILAERHAVSSSIINAVRAGRTYRWVE
jgi:hypothetical protein